MAEQIIKAFVSGTHNLLPDEVIPKDAASASNGWLTKDGHIELIYGRQLIGQAGGPGKIYGQHTGFRVDGTAVGFRKSGTKIQVLISSTWTDVITGLTETADYTFSNYQSLAGAFVFAFGIDGIYKIATANPTSYTSLFVDGTNYKGLALIDKGRTILWGRTNDPTGLYLSWIDNQRGVSGSTGVYTSVSGEATTSLTGTLAFKGSGATRTCFGVTITLTGTGEVYTDNYNGVLTGSLGGTGTINYTSGDYTMSNAGVGTAAYQWEDSNLRGVTDFRFSATRLAGEGNVFRQDIGGDKIQVVIAFDGSYFSLKSHSCYILTLDVQTDIASANEVFRTDIGIKTLRSGVGTGTGIVFINTANPSKPTLQILKRNPLGDNFDVTQLFKHFSFESFNYDDGMIDNWDEYVVVGCRSTSSGGNDRTLLCNIKNKTVDTTPYGIRASSKVNGILWGGDTVSETTYELFTGFDDLGLSVSNYWESNGETYAQNGLKKTKRYRFKGKIDPSQSIKVSISYDDGDYQQIGVILGSGDYVDYGASFAIGTTFIGQSNLGGGDTTNVYQYFMEIKVHALKFRKRKIKFEALGIGFASVDFLNDFDIWLYQSKIPARYRSKQNVSIQGTPTDQANPDY